MITQPNRHTAVVAMLNASANAARQFVAAAVPKPTTRATPKATKPQATAPKAPQSILSILDASREVTKAAEQAMWNQLADPDYVPSAADQGRLGARLYPTMR